MRTVNIENLIGFIHRLAWYSAVEDCPQAGFVTFSQVDIMIINFFVSQSHSSENKTFLAMIFIQIKNI